MPTRDALNAIIVAAENYDNNNQLHAAIRIHTAGLGPAGLLDIISGLAGFAAAALADMRREASAKYSAENLSTARREAIALAAAVLDSRDRFTRELSETQSDPRLLSAAAAQLLAYTAQCIPGLTADEVLAAANAAIGDTQ
ncbi:hypothetical protein [Nocardia flavorosea]|uniref:Uncharacterized protein n=1 Tax=Nocardia flavorosea TaxID=53429 RepID=A0A846YED2_9NOCA|nr:hypothetical protein [Nocardia flavorosea]NKY57227.1 hypothetical protein [Nocardia flavorosea]